MRPIVSPRGDLDGPHAGSFGNQVKGGVWFRLIDKVNNRKNLWSAWSKTARKEGSAGVDGITIDRYERDVESNVERLEQRLRDGSFRLKDIRRTYLPKADGTMRPLGLPR